MAASVRVFCALRVTLGGAVPLRAIGGALTFPSPVSRVSVLPLQRNIPPPAVSTASGQQVRHGSFFNKLTAKELWRGVLAETGSGARKGRGKKTKRKRQKDLNRGQSLGEGRGGFLWPGLNAPLFKVGGQQFMSRRGDAEQQAMQADILRQRDEWDRMTKMRMKRVRGWTGKSWGGVSLGPPDGPNRETYKDFDTCVIELKSVYNMTAQDGKKKSISCLVVVGNGKGAAGFAVGKARARTDAMRKAKNRAIQYLYYIERYNNHTIYHNIDSTIKKTTLRMKKQNKGYGLHCHRAIITICKLIGLQDLYCKVEGSINLLNITRALFTGLAKQETHKALADRKQLNVVEFQSERGPLPLVVAHPKSGARADPEPEEIPNTPLHWADIQTDKRSVWSNAKRTIW